VEVPPLGWTFHCPDLATKRGAFRKVESFVRCNQEALPSIRALIRDNGIDCAALAAREALTVNELRTLARHPLVTIGAHTVTHGHLARQPVETVLREMIGSRSFLEDITGSPIAHFAYPFGNEEACGNREATLAREAGFRTAVTTRRGTLFPQHLEHLHALPREPLSGEESRYSLRCKVDGVYRAVHSRWSEPVACM
jgi:peptidoglycan/xylan/chitin deacetylase (PgdA/CDA1 family)